MTVMKILLIEVDDRGFESAIVELAKGASSVDIEFDGVHGGAGGPIIMNAQLIAAELMTDFDINLLKRSPGAIGDTLEAASLPIDTTPVQPDDLAASDTNFIQEVPAELVEEIDDVSENDVVNDMLAEHSGKVHDPRCRDHHFHKGDCKW